MAKQKKIKLFEGNVPADGILLESFNGWELYQRNKAKHFMNLKLVYIGRHPRKANFWLAFDTEKRCFVRNRNSKILRMEYRALHDDVTNFLVTHG